jgi:DNA-binding NarL/FixJ family response regulator
MTPQLCAKELAIIAGLADGMQSKEIAASVQLSKASIDTYVRILFGKFGARSRAQLVALSYAAGILATGDTGAQLDTQPPASQLQRG